MSHIKNSTTPFFKKTCDCLNLIRLQLSCEAQRQTERGRCFHTPLTKFSGLCSSCVVEAQRVMRDLNIHPTTTASIFCATDLLSPVVKLFPKPALSGSNREAEETTDHTEGGLVSRGEHYWQLTSFSIKHRAHTRGKGGGAKEKGP